MTLTFPLFDWPNHAELTHPDTRLWFWHLYDLSSPKSGTLITKLPGTGCGRFSVATESNGRRWRFQHASSPFYIFLLIIYFIHFYIWLPLPIARSKGLVWWSFSSVSLCSHDSHVCGIDRQNKKLSIAVLSEWRLILVSSSSHPRLILVLPWFWSSSSLSPSESPQRQHHHDPQNTAINRIFDLYRDSSIHLHPHLPIFCWHNLAFF